MEKSKIKELESRPKQQLWSEISDVDSKEGLKFNFRSALNKLMDQPGLYYLEADANDKFAMVRKRADDSVVYETENPTEIKAMKVAGVEKKDELK